MYETFFDRQVKNNLVTYHKIWKIATGQGDDYTTVCSLDYPYFNISKTGLLLIESVLKPLGKSLLIPLRLTGGSYS